MGKVDIIEIGANSVSVFQVFEPMCLPNFEINLQEASCFVIQTEHLLSTLRKIEGN